LGGASWKSTGADGTWTKHFAPYLDLIPFSASNAGFVLSNWKNLSALAGLPVKNITLQMGDKTQKGEFVISEQGIEGGPVYAMNHLFRKGINTMYIDFKPDLKIETIYSKLIQAKNTTEALKELRLSKGSIGMIKTLIDKDTFTDSKKMSLLLKSFPLQIENLYAIDKAISTVGGIPLNALDEHFKCIAHPNWYFIGEMVDWDAPTGGYLLQACFSMAYVAGKNIVQNTSIES
jgi:predicted flavoprotein YhiN